MPEQAPVNVAAALAEKVLLICPTLSYWQGRVIHPDAKVHVPGAASAETQEVSDTVLDDEVTTRPQVNLLTNQWPTAGAPDGRPWKKMFTSLRTMQTTIVNKYSTCFPGMIGVRIVPKVAGVALFTELNDLKKDLDRVATRFCDSLPAVLTEIQGKLPENVWNSIRHKIPSTREAMRAKFNSAALPIEISTGASSTVLSMAELQAFRGEIKSEIDSRVGAAIEEMIAAPRRELASAIDELVTRLGQEGRISERTFNATRTAFDKLRHFSFAASPQLLERMRQVEDTIRRADPQTLTHSASSRTRLVETIHGIAQELKDQSAIAESVTAFKSHTRRVAI